VASVIGRHEVADRTLKPRSPTSPMKAVPLMAHHRPISIAHRGDSGQAAQQAGRSL
jgi:hypothetical protein